MDKIIRAISKDEHFFAVAASTGVLCKRSADIFGLSPAMSILFGRALTAAAMLGIEIKDEKGRITLDFDGDNRISVVADSKGHVKGTVKNPVWMPSEGEALGDTFGKNGFLTVIRDLGFGEPYSGKVPLKSGEIAEDVTDYYQKSEQTAFCCSLGVSLDKEADDLPIKAAGGFIISAMPNCPDELLKQLDENIAVLPPVSAMLDSGMTEKDVLGAALHGFDFNVTDTVTPRYFCGCSRSKIASMLAGLSPKDIDSLSAEKETEIICHYCNTVYRFTAEEIRGLKK